MPSLYRHRSLTKRLFPLVIGGALVAGCINHSATVEGEGAAEGGGEQANRQASWQPISTADSQISVIGLSGEQVKTRRAKQQSLAGRLIYSESIGHENGRISYNRIQYEEDFPIGSAEKLLVDLYGENEDLTAFQLNVDPNAIETAQMKSGSLASSYVENGKLHCVLFYLHSETSEVGETKGLLESASGNFCAPVKELTEKRLRARAEAQIASIRFDRGNYERNQSFSDLFGQLGKLESRDNLFDDETGDPTQVRPRIVVTSRVETTDESVVLKGYATASSNITLASLNGKGIRLDENGAFQTKLDVEIGDQTAAFQMVDENGLVGRRNVQITRYSADSGFLPTPRVGNFHALIIGNNDYPDWLGQYVSSNGDADLANAISDAEQLAAVLATEYDFNVDLIRDATHAQILEKLVYYRDNLTGDDNLLIFYAGHGIVVGDIGYWMPVDVQRGREDTLISNRLLSRTLSQFDVGKVMLIADSCYSASFVQQTRKVDTGDFDRFENEHSIVRAAMSSGGLEVVSDGIEQSPFNEALVDGLRKNEGTISAQQLFVYVKAFTVRKAQQTPQFGAVPASGHQDGGDFLFVRQDPFTAGNNSQVSG